MSGAMSSLARKALLLGAGTAGVTTALYLQSTRPDFQQKSFTNGLGLGRAYYQLGAVARFFVDAEQAHVLGVRANALSRHTRAALGLIDDTVDDASIHTDVMGLHFDNPVGISAGYDKHGEAIAGLLECGFGHVEVGSVTPLAQAGNPQPRVFRLQEDGAIINRYGFNSVGIHAVKEALKQRLYALHAQAADTDNSNSKHWLFGTYTHYSPKSVTGVIGLNLGKNKTSTDANADYVTGITVAGAYADYIVVNVSSPNTPGLRSLQGKEQLHSLLTAVKAARDELDSKVAAAVATAAQQRSRSKSSSSSNSSVTAAASPLVIDGIDTTVAINHRRPLLVKIAPDLTADDQRDIADVVLTVGIDGLIVSNTTVARAATLQSEQQLQQQSGGLSGKPLFAASTELVAVMHTLTGGKIPIIGVGGVSSSSDAYEKIKAGASLVQLYTAYAYQGPVLISDIKTGLQQHLKKDGYTHIAQAVGVDAHKYAAATAAAAAAATATTAAAAVTASN